MKKTVSIFILFTILLFSVQAQAKRKSLPYHGTRRANVNEFFAREARFVYSEEGGYVTVMFNTVFDTRSITKEEIALNDKRLSPEAIVTFNKAGNKMRIFDPNLRMPPGHIYLGTIKSFNGKPIKKALVEVEESNEQNISSRR